jgi:hypothetical protein
VKMFPILHRKKFPPLSATFLVFFWVSWRSSVARGGARGHSHPPSQTCFVLDKNGFFLIRLIKKNFLPICCLVHPPTSNPGYATGCWRLYRAYLTFVFNKMIHSTKIFTRGKVDNPWCFFIVKKLGIESIM